MKQNQSPQSGELSPGDDSEARGTLSHLDHKQEKQ
jgi:hypothetical protein